MRDKEKLLLSFSYDENYRYRPGFIESVKRHVNIPWKGIALGDWHDPIPENHLHLPNPPCLFAGRPVVQHGAFLDTLVKDGVAPDTLVLFVDTDAVFQRPFTGEEINHLQHVGVNNYLVGPNRFHDSAEHWQDEAPRLMPTPRYSEEYNGMFNSVPVFNTGFLAMELGVWQHVYHRCLNLIQAHGHWFGHHAATQLFLCAAMWDISLRPLIAPLTLSAHGHCGMPPLVKIVDNVAHVLQFKSSEAGLTKVAYAHMLCGL